MFVDSHYRYFVYKQPTEAPTVDKSSAAKDPTDPPSQPEDLTGPTEDFQKEDDQKPSGCEFIAESFEFLNRLAVVTSRQLLSQSHASVNLGIQL